MNETSPSQFTNKSQQVARLLLDRIVQQNLHPGSSFGTEAELLEQYDVSRPTLRECLRILESQGVISLRPGPKGGILVAKPSIDILAHTLSVFLRLHNVPLFEILRARMTIEPALVAEAALNGTEEDFKEMQQSIDRLEAGKNDIQVLFRENREFHSIIARAAHNPVLEVYWLTIHMLASGENENIKFSDKNLTHIIKAHQAILDACRKRDSLQAHALMNNHLGELDTLLKARAKDRAKDGTGRIAFRSSARTR